MILLNDVVEVATALLPARISTSDHLGAEGAALDGSAYEDFGRCVVRTGDEVLSPESRGRFRALKAETDLAMRTLIAQGVADGSIEADDIRLTASTLAGALNWPARWFSPDGPSTVGELAAAIVEILDDQRDDDLHGNRA
jgi:hypothetical protein